MTQEEVAKESYGRLKWNEARRVCEQDHKRPAATESRAPRTIATPGAFDEREADEVVPPVADARGEEVADADAVREAVCDVVVPAAMAMAS